MRGNKQVLALPNNQSGFTCVSPNVKNSDKAPIVCARGTFLRKYVQSEDMKLGSDTLWFSRINVTTKPVRVYKRDAQTGRYSVDGLPEMAKGAAPDCDEEECGEEDDRFIDFMRNSLVMTTGESITHCRKPLIGGLKIFDNISQNNPIFAMKITVNLYCIKR